MDVLPTTTAAALNLDTHDDASPRLHGRWLFVARLAGFAAIALAITTFIAGVPVEFARLERVCVGEQCVHPRLTPEMLAELEALGLSARWFAVYFIAFIVVQASVWFAIGLLLFWRKPDDRVALLVAMTLLAFGTAFGIDPRSLAAAHPLWQLPAECLSFLGGACLYLFLFLFPNGRFVPGWTRWLLVGALVLQAFESFLPETPLDIETWPPALGFAVFLVIGGGGIAAQVYRYRRASNRIHRQQTKWVIFSLISVLTILLGLSLANLFISSASVLAELVGNSAIYLTLLLIPLAILRAVMRYRLWDIDLIIKRTLVYGTLTACVVGVYVLIVGYLGTLFRAEGNLLISLIATGLVAVLFQPLRERLQRGVNRLLYGERDDPYTVVSRLGQRLEAALAPDAVLPTIVETVAQALKLPYVAIALASPLSEAHGQSYRSTDDGPQTTGEPFTIVAAHGVTPATRSPDHPSAPLRASLVTLSLSYQGEIVGQLLLAPRAPGESFGLADRRLLDDLSRQAGVAAHAVRLTNDLRLSRERLVTAREEERRRLRRDLHDGLGPVLATIAMQAEAARELLSSDPPATDKLLADLVEQAQAAVNDVRRLVYALRPPALDDLGLLGALRAHAARYAQSGLQTMIQAPDALPPLSAAVEVAAYRIVQEALTNVARHAQARRCQVTLEVLGMGARQALSLEIADDGVGLSLERQAGVGLTAMHERAAELGGSCAIAPRAGGGTRVSVYLPAVSDPAGTLVDQSTGAVWEAAQR